jgi:hypothetical protein
MIFDDRFSGTSLDLDTTKSTNSLGFERPSGTTQRHLAGRPGWDGRPRHIPELAAESSCLEAM